MDKDLIKFKDLWDVNKLPAFEMPEDVKKEWYKNGYHPGTCTCCWCGEEHCRLRWDLYNTRGDCLWEK